MRHWFRHLFGRCVRCEAEKRLARICVDCGYEHDDYDWLNDPLKRLRELRARALNGFATNAPEMAIMNTRMTEAELEELDRLERLPR